MQGLEHINKWKIPRRLSQGKWLQENSNVELVAFCDASEKAYGCVVYLKTKDQEQAEVSLVISKVRVAPVKRVTLPRLELLGALLAARLLKFVKTALLLESEVKYSCWIDSMIALSWIQSDPHRWKQFVCNRVTEIQELTNPAQWKHCSRKDNPADLLTRGIEAKTLLALGERTSVATS